MTDPLDNVRLITGDCREVLAGMEAESVQCVVTSPPYWSLRDYGLEASVWGGDGEACEHEWGAIAVADKTGKHRDTEERRACLGKSPGGLASWTTREVTTKGGSGQFCSRCGAWLGCLGLEPTPDLYVAHILEVFRGVRRVLREDGVLWLNLGDGFASGKGACFNPGGGVKSYVQEKERYPLGRGNKSTLAAVGLKPKDLCCIPWRVAMALQADGWYLRAALPWVKRSAMPESASDRPNSAVEYVFQLTKSGRYYFDMEAVRVALAPTAVERDRYSRILEDDGPQAVRHDHETQGNPAGRHFRNGDLWFQSISEPHGMVFLDDEPVGLDVTPAGFSEAHFATFPPCLVEPLIKSGTSEKGCCPKCGKPWERVIDRSEKVEIPHYSDRSGAHRADAPGAVVSETSCFRTHQVAVPRTLGWRPICSCTLDPGPFSIARVGFDPVPCLCLDPFSGAGTVALVAARLGRRAIGIEAKAEYNAMAEKRIGRALRPATYQDTSEPGPGKAPLFEETNP